MSGQKKRILLLNPPAKRKYIRDYYCSFSSKAGYYWPSQELLVLSGILAKEHEVQVLDAVVSNLSFRQCYKKIMDMDIGVVVFTTGTATIKTDLEFLKKIKDSKDILLIASSSIFNFAGKKIMEAYPYLDVGIKDFTTDDILKLLNGDEGSLNNIIYRKANEIRDSGLSRERSFKIPIPRHELFGLHRYKLSICRRYPFTVVVTSIGCPYGCLFCVAGAIRYKTRDINNTMEELSALVRMGIREVLFQDPDLTINREHIYKLCSEMIKKDLKVFWMCNADVSSLDEKLLILMKKAGCHSIHIGVESGDEKILKRYSRKIRSKEQVKEVFRLCRKCGIETLAYFIIGLPGEDKKSVLSTLRLARELNCDYVSFSVATPDMGTKLRSEAIQKGWVPPGLDVFDSSAEAVIATDKLSKEDINKLVNRAYREFYLRPSYIIERVFHLRNIGELLALVRGGYFVVKRYY